jgi:hypothetical protein
MQGTRDSSLGGQPDDILLFLPTGRERGGGWVTVLFIPTITSSSSTSQQLATQPFLIHSLPWKILPELLPFSLL